jgi:hypothetical protein
VSRYYDANTRVLNASGIQFVKEHLVRIGIQYGCCAKADSQMRIVDQLYGLRAAEQSFPGKEARFVLVVCEHCYNTKLYNVNEMGLDAP